ncbi:chymotrypsin family serine protease [Halorussus ruber]|uniref:hypothetical protein n=1 Tax=Halorussus ruber TaxID=1126238 RepID=UPI0010920689|nr:hypothetical protein [Halorussus ruber]
MSQKFKRRNVIKSVGAGITFSGISSRSAASQRDIAHIVTVRGGDGTPRQTKKVDEGWWKHVEKVEELQNKLRSRYAVYDSSIDTGVEGVGIGSTDEKINGRTKSKLTVYTSQDSPLKREVPSDIDGIPITVKETPDVELDCGKSETDWVEGGYACDMDDSNGPGTFTCQVKKDGSYYMMTAAHVVNTNCGDPNGNKVYNYGPDGNYVGDVEMSSLKEDWALVSEASDSDISGFDNGIYNQVGKLAGHVTKSGLHDLKDGTVYQQGWRTCETSGSIDEIDITSGICDVTDDHYVKTTTNTEAGDSGGPHFHRYTYSGCEHLAIVAPHHGGEAIGCAAYHLNDIYGIQFDPNYSLC